MKVTRHDSPTITLRQVQAGTVFEFVDGSCGGGPFMRVSVDPTIADQTYRFTNFNGSVWSGNDRGTLSTLIDRAVRVLKAELVIA